MFNTLLSRVTFDELVAFCGQFPEGVRVEYKAEPVHIPKIIASLANTVGGFFVIGVRTNDKNMPILPIEGMPARKGIEEQIVQSSQTSIYPAITPDVRVLDVPRKKDRVVVIVKVPESIEAPHAVDDATKVYVRVASTTPPSQLADVDRIDYLLKRRHAPEARREEIIASMTRRSTYAAHGTKLRVVVAPVYPRGVLLPMDALAERAEILRQQRVRYLHHYRLIHNGIRSVGANPGQHQWYFEVDTRGVTFFEEPTPVVGDLRDRSSNRNVTYVNLNVLAPPIAAVLNAAISLLAGAPSNLLVRYELHGFRGIGFVFLKPSDRPNPFDEVMEYVCFDTEVVASTFAALETVKDERVRVVTTLLRDALYAFNVETQADDLAARVYEILKQSSVV